MCRIDAGNMREILDPLPIHKLFGVGQKTLPTVLAAGIRTFGDARSASDAVLWRAFGKHGKAMRDRASGLDDRPVESGPRRKVHQRGGNLRYGPSRAARSSSAQLKALADRTASRLRAHKLLAGRVSVKIRRGDFTTYTRQRALEPADPGYGRRVRGRRRRCSAPGWRRSPRAAVRLLGVGVGDLQVLRQSDLFSGPQPDSGSRLDSAVDGIRDRFGAGPADPRQPSAPGPGQRKLIGALVLS